MNTERNKFLTEVLGECWHEYQVKRWCTDTSRFDAKCIKCGLTTNGNKEWVSRAYRNNFSTWADFGKLWEWAQKQEWWKEFCFSPIGDGYHCYQVPKGLDKFAIGCAYIHPDRFADAVYQFLKGIK